MRILVAGCGGFIGFHLVERLLGDGHEVSGVDDLSTGQEFNVAELQPRSGFQFHRCDISAAIPELGRFDRVYNMACPASPADFRDRSLEILAVCSRGVWNLLDLCRRSGARFLQSSTSEVYGDPKVHPQTEDYWGHANPIGPRSCYDEGKRFGEALIVNYARVHAVPVRIARIFNTYGPRMRADDGRALPNFVRQSLRGEPLTVHGDGRQTRSFCYVTDLVDGLVRLMESDVTGPVNLGNPSEMSVLEFAQAVIAAVGSRSEVVFHPRPGDDPELRRPDITRAQTLLGWAPRVSLEEGLRVCVEWYAPRLSG